MSLLALTLSLLATTAHAQQDAPGINAPSAEPKVIHATPKVIADAMNFTEGPLWHDGKLLICDLGAGIVYTLTPREDDPATPEPELWKKDEFRTNSERAAGSALDHQSRLLLAHFTGKVTRTEKDGTVTTIAQACGTGESSVPLARCNDLCARRDGTIYFTDFGKKGSPSKGVFRITPAGKVESLDTDYAAANGIALSHDESTLYVADYGKNIIISHDVNEDGTIRNRRVFVNLSDETGKGQTDGLKALPDGRVLTTGPGGVWVLSGSGEKLGLIKVEGGASNLCFGGENGATLFITSGTRVLSTPVPEVAE